jgi:hypothetical protein
LKRLHSAASWVALATALISTPAFGAEMRRFALLVGNNTGGEATEPLRYAEADVDKLATVLHQLGGFREGDLITALGSNAIDVEHQLAQLEDRLRAVENENVQTTLLLYYSGHAKQGDLWLGDSRLPMAVIRKHLSESSADVKIGIIDSCESGAITREKGGKRGPSFLFELDDREAARGLILISSSSEDESSQESDELGGSFFTHYLASGLRGDADESGDARVTLGEVYKYTYHKTVNVTANTRSGTQHPTYAYDLEGQGDIILTEISRGSSGVLFPEALAGDYLIFDMQRDQVAAEIAKKPGSARKLALPPGDYVVKKRLTDHLRMARFGLARDQYYSVDEAVMDDVAFEDDYAKGSVLRMELEHSRTRANIRTVAVFQSFFSASARKELFPTLFMFGAGVEVGPFIGAHLGLELLLGGDRANTLRLGDLAVDFRFFEAEVALSMLWRLDLGPFALYAGPRLSGLYFLRSFPNDPVLSEHSQDFFGISPALSAGALWFPFRDRDFSIEILARAGFLSYGVDDNRALFFSEVGLSVGYRP